MELVPYMYGYGGKSPDEVRADVEQHRQMAGRYRALPTVQKIDALCARRYEHGHKLPMNRESLEKLWRDYCRLTKKAIRAAAGDRLDTVLAVMEKTPAGKPEGKAMKLTKAQENIRDVIREAGRRLTQEQVLERLEKKHGVVSTGTTYNYLAAMVRSSALTNRQDVDPPGYGLPEWDI